MDKGLKAACLFDHWSVNPDAMVSYLMSLHMKGLISDQLRVLQIGLDVVVYNVSIKVWLESFQVESSEFMDVTSNLAQPLFISDTNRWKVAVTMNTFNQWICLAGEADSSCAHEIEITDGLNVPALFGLLLGYPCVYWYDRSVGEENNLNGCSLRLYQVKGHHKSQELSQEFGHAKDTRTHTETLIANSVTKDNGCSTVYSFTIPELLVESVRDKVLTWYQAWERSVPWSVLFSSVTMSEQSIAPSAVCL